LRQHPHVRNAIFAKKKQKKRRAPLAVVPLRAPLCTQAMNDSTHSPADSEAAWQRHYVTVAERRNETSLRRMGKRPPYLRYRRREVRLAYTIAVVVVGLLLAAWASV
jgi:hypothetical protein